MKTIRLSPSSIVDAGFDGRHNRTDGIRGYGLYQRKDYGTEENDTRVYHGAAAKRDIRVRQQSQRYARRWCGLYRIPQVLSHHGSGRGSAGPELRHPDDARRRRNFKPYVDEFIQFAKEHQELTFLVTRIGCGIAGFTDEEIAPLFEQAHGMENIVLPPGW